MLLVIFCGVVITDVLRGPTLIAFSKIQKMCLASYQQADGLIDNYPNPFNFVDFTGTIVRTFAITDKVDFYDTKSHGKVTHDTDTPLAIGVINPKVLVYNEVSAGRVIDLDEHDVTAEVIYRVPVIILRA